MLGQDRWECGFPATSGSPVLFSLCLGVFVADNSPPPLPAGPFEESFLLSRERLDRAGVTEAEWRATYDLLRTRPGSCAWRVLTRFQKVAGLLILVGLAAFLALNAKLCLTLVNGFFITFYLVMTAYKVYLIHHSLGLGNEIRFTADELGALRDEDLPLYTILVPLYQEAESLPRLIEGLRELDYPEDKLDALLLLEENDAETRDAVAAMDLPDFIQVVVTPDSLPKTKPKACNLGLTRARGEFLVIYDAEDRPEALQLKKAVVGFKKRPSAVCLQAKLNFYNQKQNLLTRLFTVEYSMWFDLILPGMTESDAPLPLGGTSNHFRTERLRELGGWDPFNVTEDCDLGLRLSAEGCETRIIDSTTWEEACSDLGYWLRQRSRWTKGYIQTYLVHLRRPLDHVRGLGLGRALSFHLTIGGTPLSLLINPVYWIMTTLWFTMRWEKMASLFPFPIILGGLVCLFVGNFVFVYACVLAAYRRGYFSLVKYTLLVPAYWLLMSVGAWKGFLQLITRPSYWEKTKHALDLAASRGYATGAEPENATE